MEMKRGYYFTLDALIATGILVIGIIYILSSKANVIVSEPTKYYAQNYLDSFDRPISKIFNPALDTLIKDGKITDVKNTVLEEIVKLNEDYPNDAQSLITSISLLVLPSNVGYSFIVNGVPLSSGGNIGIDKASVVSTAKKIIVSKADKSNLNLFVVEVNVWH